MSLEKKLHFYIIESYHFEAEARGLVPELRNF
jgi:hypothetical protein